MTENKDFDPFDDPWGYRVALNDALARWREQASSLEQEASNHLAAWVLRCRGRCHLYSISIDESKIKLDGDLANQGMVGLVHQIDIAAELVTSLPERWYEQDDPWEADELCLDLLKLRTDLWGVQLTAAGPQYSLAEFQSKIARFDEQLRSSKSTLCTVVDSSQYESLRDDIAESLGVEQLPWWLGDELTDAVEDNANDSFRTLPPKEILAEVHRLQSWRRMLPTEVEQGVLAAATNEDRSSYDVVALIWDCPPDIGDMRAELLLPSESFPASESELRPLGVWTRTEEGMERAREFSGALLRIGTFSGVLDENAEVRLTIRDLRNGCDGLMFVGDSEVPWLPRLERDE